ncbi:hypothetical protein C1J01_32160 [Nonomuraea aridisoli]|uniref:Uncharacterized protein n=1 Tax=Nonomuraea aridisoli TaxID=2070368 RepID=A0A2W2DR40_9ACTN|nr:hypothetical protein C1J01_32160 [Nonomuraea aridisoli]
MSRAAWTRLRSRVRVRPPTDGGAWAAAAIPAVFGVLLVHKALRFPADLTLIRWYVSAAADSRPGRDRVRAHALEGGQSGVSRGADGGAAARPHHFEHAVRDLTTRHGIDVSG